MIKNVLFRSIEKISKASEMNLVKNENTIDADINEEIVIVDGDKFLAEKSIQNIMKAKMKFAQQQVKIRNVHDCYSEI